MDKYLLFGILSLPLLALSRRSLLKPGSHGFYRFFSWECIAWLAVSVYPFWFSKPFSPIQLISWSLLFVSVYLLIAGLVLLKRSGKAGREREEKALYAFEKTTVLIDSGIYRYIRHPLYASLLFLSWGICLKSPAFTLWLTALLSSVFLYLTALADERECIEFFGEKYREYMKRSKMFIPFLV